MRVIRQSGRHVGLALAVLTAVFPFYWMMKTSISPHHEVSTGTYNLIPREIDFSGYQRAWELGGVGPAMLVGLIVALGILVLQLITCVPAAYVLATHRAAWTGKVLVLLQTEISAYPLLVSVQCAIGGSSIDVVPNASLQQHPRRCCCKVGRRAVKTPSFILWWSLRADVLRHSRIPG